MVCQIILTSYSSQAKQTGSYNAKTKSDSALNHHHLYQLWTHAAYFLFSIFLIEVSQHMTAVTSVTGLNWKVKATTRCSLTIKRKHFGATNLLFTDSSNRGCNDTQTVGNDNQACGTVKSEGKCHTFLLTSPQDVWCCVAIVMNPRRAPSRNNTLYKGFVLKD